VGVQSHSHHGMVPTNLHKTEGELEVSVGLARATSAKHWSVGLELRDHTMSFLNTAKWERTRPLFLGPVVSLSAGEVVGGADGPCPKSTVRILAETLTANPHLELEGHERVNNPSALRD